MQARLDPYLRYPRFRAILLAAFSFLATMLPAVAVPVALGLALGLLISFAVTRYLAALLYGVTPADALTLGR